MVRESEFKSEDPGFDPLAGLGNKQVCFLSLRVKLSCADLFVSHPPSCVRHAPKFVRTLKILYPSVVKEQASQSVACQHEHTSHRGEKAG